MGRPRTEGPKRLPHGARHRISSPLARAPVGSVFQEIHQFFVVLELALRASGGLLGLKPEARRADSKLLVAVAKRVKLDEAGSP